MRKKFFKKQRRSNSFKSKIYPLYWDLASAGLFGLVGMIVSCQALAATTGSLSGANIQVNDGDTIVADSGTSPGMLHGVLNPAGQQGTIDLGSHVSVSADDPAATVRGISIEGNGSILSADALTVKVSGNSATGISLSGRNVSADLGTDSRVSVRGAPGERASGILISNASSLTADRLLVETTGDYGTGISLSNHGSSASLGSGSSVITNGRLSYGLYVAGLNGTAANGPARLTADGLHISTQGYGADGINIQNNAAVDLGTGSAISTTGDNAHGIWSFGEFYASGLSVDTVGSGANAVEVRGGRAVIGNDSHVSSASGGGLVANGTGTAIDFTGSDNARNTVSAGGSYAASAQTPGAEINLSYTDLSIDRGGALALGLWALNGGTITGDNLSISGAEGTRGVYAMSDSQINLNGDLDINMASPAQMAIATQHDDGYSASRINAAGRMRINGSVYARGGIIDLAMASGSDWTGSAFTDNLNGGRLDVSLNDGTWRVTGDSGVDTLSLNNATVDLASMAPASGDFTTLNMANLDGSGMFIMRTDVKGGAGDLLRVTGTSAGSHILTVRNQGGMATDGSEVLTVVETADGGASFTSSSQVELGGYLYDVRRNGTNWELYAAGSVPAPAPEPTPE
ncbi:autotransporter outer membrane beta-barrel domain-containing protein, partial [Enterobacter cloacae]